MRIAFRSGPYQASEWFSAWIIKNGVRRLVSIGLPYYTWKETFRAYATKRGFSVIWR